MIILGIDPSINETGWAVLRTGANYSVILNGPNQRGYAVEAHGVIRSKLRDPYDRLLGICNDATYLRKKYAVTDVVIETTSGKLAARLKGTNANMLLYPVAVGGLVMTFELLKMVAIDSKFDKAYGLHLVLENFWTGGVPKAKRNAATIAEFGLPKKTNHNAVDAIGLVAWWWSHRKLLAGKAIIEEVQACQKPEPKQPKKKVVRKKRPTGQHRPSMTRGNPNPRPPSW